MNRRDFLKVTSGFLLAPQMLVTDNHTLDFWREVQEKIKEFQITKRGKVLEDHPALRENPSICYSGEMLKIATACRYGILPSELEQASFGDQVNIYAYHIAMSQIEKVEIWEAEQRNKTKFVK